MSLKFNCSELVNVIKAGKTAIFCGAGISFNSGLPIVSGLLNYMFSKMDMPINEQNLIRHSDLPFESIMEMILQESGLDEIIEIFQAGSPNANHIFIAKLAKKGYLKIIYTTNFDTLIEKALKHEGLIEGKEFCVYSSEAELNAIEWDNRLIKVVKIHGCARKKEDMVITMAMIASDRYSEMRRNVMQVIFNSNKCDNVLVLGYSCSDLDLTPLIESFESGKANIHFIEHLMPANDGLDYSKCEPVSSKIERNPFKNYKGSRYVVNTDELVKSVWVSLLEDEYNSPSIPVSDWQHNIDDWYVNSVNDSGEGVKHHIASRLLYAIGEFRKAIEHHKKAISIARESGNVFAYAAETGNLGMALSAIGDYKQAILCFNKSIPLCRRNGFTQGLSFQLQSLGTLLHRTGDDIKAIEAHKEALKYAELEKDENSMSTILGNMSNSYNKIGQLDNARKSLEQAIVLSRKLGNKQAESSQLGIIAFTYLQEGNTSKAIECCLKGIEIKKTIADRHGECQMLFNLTSLYVALGEIQQARQTGKECMELANAIGNNEIKEVVKSMVK